MRLFNRPIVFDEYLWQTLNWPGHFLWNCFIFGIFVISVNALAAPFFERQISLGGTTYSISIDSGNSCFQSYDSNSICMGHAYYRFYYSLEHFHLGTDVHVICLANATPCTLLIANWQTLTDTLDCAVGLPLGKGYISDTVTIGWVFQVPVAKRNATSSFLPITANQRNLCLLLRNGTSASSSLVLTKDNYPFTNIINYKVDGKSCLDGVVYQNSGGIKYSLKHYIVDSRRLFFSLSGVQVASTKISGGVALFTSTH